MSPAALRAAVVATCLSAILGCSGGSPVGTPSPHPSSAHTPKQSAATVPALQPPDWSLFPDQDTPIASAPAPLVAAWTPYGVTVIPGRHVLDGVPPTPPVRNVTGGAVSDADAQRWAAAEMRTDGYVGWMEANGQPGFNDHLRTHAFLAGPIGASVLAQHHVMNPPCDLFPTAIAVVPVDAAIQSFFGSRGLETKASFALVMTYSRGADVCVVTETTSSGPHVLASVPAGGGTGIEGGSLRHDTLLGDLWFSDSAGDCRAGQMPAACEANQ
jgi:hypothetical protein